MEKSHEKINGLRLTKCSDERYKPKHCINITVFTETYNPIPLEFLVLSIYVR